MDQRQILVLGVGNILMSDEGVGVYCIQKLVKEYIFSDNIQLLDGGTLGMRLLYPISRASNLIVADTAILGNTPGTISRLSYDDIKMKTVLKNSMHQLSFAETLMLADTMGILPGTTIITMEPQDIESMSTTLTPIIAGKIDNMCKILLNEIIANGGDYRINVQI